MNYSGITCRYVLFPYYLVYFKARTLRPSIPQSRSISILFSLFQSSFFTAYSIPNNLISILFSLFQSHAGLHVSEAKHFLFPYYLVYFKAVLAWTLTGEPCRFPYYLVYFKAGGGPPPLPPGAGFPYYLVYFKAHR